MVGLCQGRSSALRYFKSLCGDDGKFQRKAKGKGSDIPGLDVLSHSERRTVRSWGKDVLARWTTMVGTGTDPSEAFLALTEV